MINIRKPFEITDFSNLEPGDLVSSIVNTSSAYGIITNEIGSGFNVIIMDDLNGKKDISIGHHSVFGGDFVVKYSEKWSIVPIREFYTINKGSSSLAFKIGAIAIAEQRSTIYVDRGPGMTSGARIDLGTLQLAQDNPAGNEHAIISKWELWLDADIEKSDGKALFTFDAAPPTR